MLSATSSTNDLAFQCLADGLTLTRVVLHYGIRPDAHCQDLKILALFSVLI